VLLTPIELHGGGSTTVIAETEVDGALPKASRFVGTATSDGEGRLFLRFPRVLLPGGREAKTEGEAEDATGAFGLEAVVTKEGGDSPGSVAKDIASDTVSEVASEALSTLTGGLSGRIARNAIGRASSHSASTHLAKERLSLSAGTKFQVFLHQAVIPNR
jgi:hypothetical protein